MTPAKWAIRQTATNAFIIDHDFDIGGWVKDWEWRCLLSFDRHHDNPHCDQQMELDHLNRVKELNTYCLDGGDLFCAMQGKYDRRSNKSDIRPEHQDGEYLDKLVTTAADFFAPYAGNMPMLGYGNHETAILKNHETNLTERLAQLLRDRTGEKVLAGGYTTWIRFNFRFKSPSSKSGYKNRMSKVLWMFHGSGGDAPMSFGTLSVKRHGSVLPDADIVASGHSHNEFVVPLTRARLSDRGVPHLDEQLHIKVPTYKEEYGEGKLGWHIETGKPPKPTGATWLIFKYDRAGRGKETLEHQVYCDTERAK